MILQLLILLVSGSALAADWCYTPGEHCVPPQQWPEVYQNCSGAQQSPTAIWLNEFHVEPYHCKKKGGIHLHQYDLPISNFTIVNNGHTIILPIPSGHDLMLEGGHLPGKYKLTQLHFHWGQSDNMGSEHTIGFTPYPLELHLVHINEQTNQPEAVLAVFYQLDYDQPSGTSDKTGPLDEVVKHLPSVVSPRTVASVQAKITISDFLPPNLDNYIYYKGSLTTPPCTEGIHWTILTQPQNVSRFQLAQFRYLQSATGYLGNNYRPTQPLYGRKAILYTYNAGSSITTRSSIIAAILYLLMKLGSCKCS